MAEYAELIKALRSASTVSTAWGKLMLDAAAAIEDMAKHITEMHERVTVLQIARGELEAEVKKAAKCNPELHAELQKWVSAAVQAGEPKRGEWSEENRRPRSMQFVCSVCHRTAYDPQPTRDKAWRKRCRYSYCPNCGAKMMEVQDADK